MMRNLRDRLNAVATPKPPPKPVEMACLVRDTRSPLAEYPGLFDVSPWHVRMLRGPNAAQDVDHPFDPRRALFVDTETTGLAGSGTVAFLIGVGFVEGDSFVVRQLLMRDYPQEPAQLALFAELMQERDWIVSFNGKSFDLPLLQGRFTMQRMGDSWREVPHLDLLHAARRVWKLRLPDCKLQRLETDILGFQRPEDLPSAEVPQRFFDYLKTGNMFLLEDVLRHNVQDIRTLALLLAQLSQVYEHAEAQQSFLDVFSLGRSFARSGEVERARRCFRVASVGDVADQARWHLADSYRRTQEHSAAEAIYLQMIQHGQGGIAPYVRLAILAEHQQKDLAKALTHTRAAMLRASPVQLPELEKRRARLARKLSQERGHSSWDS